MPKGVGFLLSGVGPAPKPLEERAGARSAFPLRPLARQRAPAWAAQMRTLRTGAAGAAL